MQLIDQETEQDWERLLAVLEKNLGKRPTDINAVLFLIGIQELGKGAITFTKEQKQDLMHIAVCKILSLSGYYDLEGIDNDGWPHWSLNKAIPHINLITQEAVIKHHIIRYFKEEIKLF